MRRLSVVAALAFASSCAGTAKGPRSPLTATDIARRSTPAVVQISAGPEKVGTGFIVDKTGVIATNLHVVAGESAIQVRLHDGSQYPVVQIAALDRDRDLALLRIRPAKDLPILKLGDSSAVSPGDWVVAIGNPLGVFSDSVTDGLISQIRPWCEMMAELARRYGKADVVAQHCTGELTVLQFSAAISPGSSGGPLFNQFGEVIGITSAIITSAQNINFAIPGNYLKPMVAQNAALAPDRFAQLTRTADETAASEGEGRVQIVHRVPVHELSVFDGCKPEEILELVRQISEAIENGAPLYNEGKHEACFRIYEGTAVKFEHDASCRGVRAAFGDGLLRASGLTTYTEKAWAMRDTFDGLINAVERWVAKHPGALPPPKK